VKGLEFRGVAKSETSKEVDPWSQLWSFLGEPVCLGKVVRVSQGPKESL
jgi:hypothetical protein